MQAAITIILPMYNHERRLRRAVLDILELNQTMSVALELVIVDDGSTDETYETACELSRAYPQVTVFRQSVRRGIGAALDLVRHRRQLERVVVHDGISAIDASELKSLLQSAPQMGPEDEQRSLRETAAPESAGSRRFASVSILHRSMEQAHRCAVGFMWMHLERPLVPRRCAEQGDSTTERNLQASPVLPRSVSPTY